MSLNGKWFNELGSELVLKEGPGGQLAGSYETAVGTCAKGTFPLSGWTDLPFEGETFGFAVTWHNADSECNSTTVWVGHYRPPEEGGEETLTTFWMLADKAGPSEQWESTLLGQDVFVRQTAAAKTQATATPERAANP